MSSTERQPSRRRRLLTVAGAILVLAVSACAEKNLPQDSLDPEGPIARDIDNLFTIVVWIAAVIFVLVQGALIVSIWRHRRRRDDVDIPVRQVHGNTRLEVLWTIIPALILAGIAVPTVSTIFDIRSEPDDPNRLDITVIGHQWWWEFEYPEYGFVTANEMHIPAGRTVYLTMTSEDVIHSFWVPKLNGKRDLVPGRTSNLTLIADDPTDPDEPLFGQCAEFCGLAHADMRVRVFVDSEEDFEAWAQAQATPPTIAEEGLAAEGWQIFQAVCAACHAIDGTIAQAAFGPNLSHFAGRTTFAGAVYDNTVDHMKQWLRNPSDLKPMKPELNDLEEGRILGMPNLGLTEDEIDALIALLYSLE